MRIGGEAKRPRCQEAKMPLLLGLMPKGLHHPELGPVRAAALKR